MTKSEISLPILCKTCDNCFRIVVDHVFERSVIKTVCLIHPAILGNLSTGNYECMQNKFDNRYLTEFAKVVECSKYKRVVE